MILSNARWYRHDHYPMLSMEIDGRIATFIPEVKPTLHMLGFVYVGPEFADLFPPQPIEFGPGNVATLAGITNDRRIYALVSDFLEACNDGTFAEVGVPIPG